MQIQKAVRKDTEEIVHVERHSGYKHPPNFDPFKNTIALFNDKKERIFIAKENKKVVGYITLRQDKNNVGDIGFLAILTEYQRKGIGAKLMNYVETYARRNNYKELVLVVRDTNEKAIQMYRKHKFIIVGRKKSGDKIKLMMSKKIE